jgi:hypothetical protein
MRYLKNRYYVIIGAGFSGGQAPFPPLSYQCISVVTDAGNSDGLFFVVITQPDPHIII